MKFVKFTTVAFFSVFSVAAIADEIEYLVRCEKDSLDPALAVERTEWWLNCRIPEVHAVVEGYAGEPIPDDEEARAYIRTRYLFTRKGTLKPRPMYPTFLSGNQIVIAPVDRNAPCNSIPDNSVSNLVCTSSCYKPDVQVLFKGGYTPIFEAFSNKVSEISAVSAKSTLDKIFLVNRPVESYTESVVDTLHYIKNIQMKSGRVLKVTENHPLVNSDGRIVEASSLNVGDKVLRADGTAEAIVSSTTEEYFGKVYNVSPKSNKKLEKLVIAEGYLSGSSWYQNDGVLNMNRILLRTKIPEVLLK